MNRPAATVVIPTFNRRSLVIEAIDSVRAQTRPDFEVIVVDDGSTDGTVHILDSRYADDQRISILGRTHRGVAAARNLGLERARGTYVTFLDSDDVFVPTCLEEQIACLEAHPDAALVHCDAAYEGVFDERDPGMPKRLFEMPGFRAPDSLDAMFAGASGLNCCMLLKSDVAQAVRFDGSYPVAEIQDFLFRFFAAGHQAVMNDSVLAIHRASDDPEAEVRLSRDPIALAIARLRMVRAHKRYASSRATFASAELGLARQVAEGLASQDRYREAQPYIGTWLKRQPFHPRATTWMLKALLRFGKVPRRG